MKTTEALNDKILRLLKDKHDAYLGTEGQKSRDDFKAGLSWAMETIETLTRDAVFGEVVRQVIKHLGDVEMYNPHHIAVISNSDAKLFEQKHGTGIILDYVPD